MVLSQGGSTLVAPDYKQWALLGGGRKLADRPGLVYHGLANWGQVVHQLHQVVKYHLHQK